MPVIEFSEQDIKRGTLVTPAWYLMRVETIGEAPSKNKENPSTNYPVDAIILKNSTDGSEEFVGVPISWNFNSKAKGFITPFLEAFGVKPEAGKRIELNSAVGKELQVYVENDTYDGRLINKVNSKFKPAE